MIESFRAALALHTTGGQSRSTRSLSHMLDEQFDDSASEAAPLKRTADHQSPEIVFPLLRVIEQHEKTDGGITVTDGAWPGGVGDVCFGLRVDVAGDEAVLSILK